MSNSEYEKHKFELAKRWYLCGKAEDDAFDKFIYLWISYNALYGKYGEGDKGGTYKLAVESYSPAYNAVLISEDARYFAINTIKDCRKRKPNKDGKMPEQKTTQEAKDKYANTELSGRERLAGLMMCIYQVRCNLFHGDKMPESPANLNRDTEIVGHAAKVVEQFLDIYFSEEH